MKHRSYEHRETNGHGKKHPVNESPDFAVEKARRFRSDPYAHHGEHERYERSDREIHRRVVKDEPWDSAGRK